MEKIKKRDRLVIIQGSNTGTIGKLFFSKPRRIVYMEIASGRESKKSKSGSEDISSLQTEVKK